MNKIKIAFQGIAGAYSQQAITEYGERNSIDFEPVSKRSFRDLFEAIDNETYLGFVPIENSTAGSVVECYDLFLDYNFEIIGEYNLNVRHCLLAKNSTQLKDVKKIFSHPQALAQCSQFIEKNSFMGFSVFDTAGSAKKLTKIPDNDCAAIASEIAAKHYKLKILKRDFQNDKNNTTRFLLVKKRGKYFPFERKLPKADKSSLIFELKSIPAALYKCLGGFATNQVNLTKIESRPLKRTKFQYLFYIDIDGTPKDKNVRLALEELTFFSNKLIFLGSYGKDSHNIKENILSKKK